MRLPDMEHEKPDDNAAEKDQPRDPDAPIRGQVRCSGHQRISHGLYRLTVDGLTPHQHLVRELESWLLVLPDDARFTHLTGAMLLGWDLPKLPEGVPVFASVSGHSTRPRRPGLICSRLVTTPMKRTVDGLPIDEPEEILLRAARDLGMLDLRILVEGALRKGHINPDRMSVVLASRRPGVRKLRAVCRMASAKTQSGGETILLVFHEVMQIAVEPQKSLYDDLGNLVAQADLHLTGTHYLHEYDGEVHRGKKQHTSDLRRERGLAGTPYVRKGFTLDDMLNHSLVVMHELDRALDRPHQMKRHARWRTIVDQSLYCDLGRDRLLNRWHREIGVVEWSKTA